MYALKPNKFSTINSIFMCSVIVFAVLFVSFYASYLKSANPGTDIIKPLIYLQCGIASSYIIAAILPCFRLLFQSSELTNYPLSPYTKETEKNTVIPIPSSNGKDIDPGLGDRLAAGYRGESSSITTGEDSEISKVRSLTL